MSQEPAHRRPARFISNALRVNVPSALVRELSMSLRKARRAVTVEEPMAAEVAASGRIDGAFSAHRGILRPVEIPAKVIADAGSSVSAPGGISLTLHLCTSRHRLR